MAVCGPVGATSFTLFTSWNLPHVDQEFKALTLAPVLEEHPENVSHREAMFRVQVAHGGVHVRLGPSVPKRMGDFTHLTCSPMPADIGYHAAAPTSDWQRDRAPSQQHCDWLEGRPCWLDAECRAGLSPPGGWWGRGRVAAARGRLLGAVRAGPPPGRGLPVARRPIAASGRLSMSKRMLGRTWRDIATGNQDLLTKALMQLHESGVEVARLRVALMKTEELATRPNLDDRTARGEIWALVSTTLGSGA
jgi:hypothetical protein